MSEFLLKLKILNFLNIIITWRIEVEETELNEKEIQDPLWKNFPRTKSVFTTVKTGNKITKKLGLGTYLYFKLNNDDRIDQKMTDFQFNELCYLFKIRG